MYDKLSGFVKNTFKSTLFTILLKLKKLSTCRWSQFVGHR